VSCPHCRAAVPEESSSCPRCGRPQPQAAPPKYGIATVSLALGVLALCWTGGVVLLLARAGYNTSPRHEVGVAMLMGWLIMLPSLALSLTGALLGIRALLRYRKSPPGHEGRRRARYGVLCATLSWLAFPILAVVLSSLDSLAHRLQARQHRLIEEGYREGPCEGLVKLLAEVEAGDEEVREEARRELEHLTRQPPPATCLCHAIDDNSPEVAQWMIDRGVDLNAQSCSGDVTPLRAAVSRGEVGITRRLLAFGADPNLGGREGPPPLAIAAKQASLPIVRLLLEKGAQVDVRTVGPGERQWTALHFAASLRSEGSSTKESVIDRAAVVGELLDHGADPTALDDSGHTPLHLAALGAFPEGAERLLQRCAAQRCTPSPLEMRNRQGYTALDLARQERERASASWEAPYDRVIAMLEAWAGGSG
jgi:hypothetical protein